MIKNKNKIQSKKQINIYKKTEKKKYNLLPRIWSSVSVSKDF